MHIGYREIRPMALSFSTHFPRNVKRNDSFMLTVRPILFFNRVFGTVCIVPTENQNKKGRQTKLSEGDLLYSCLVSVILAVSLPIIKWSFGDVQDDVSYWWYSRARLVLLLAIQLECLRKQRLMFVLFSEISNLRVEINRRTRFVLRLLPASFFLMVAISYIIYSILSSDSILEGFLSFILGMAPFTIVMCIYLQFSCQVVALNVAIADINVEVRNILKEPKMSSLRPVMRRHQKLQEISRSLNSAYGLILLLSTTAGFLEATSVCLVVLYDYPWGEIVFWIFWGIVNNTSFAATMQVCQVTEDKFRVTRSLCRVMTKGISKFPKSLAEEANEWKFQTKHQQMQFSSCGLIYLNSHQNIKVAGAIISYAAVFAQFLTKS